MEYGRLKFSNLDNLQFIEIPAISKYISLDFKYNNQIYHIFNKNKHTVLYKKKQNNQEELLEKICNKEILTSELIKFKNNKIELNSIDKENFVKVLYKYELIDTNIAQLKLEILEEQDKEIENEYLNKAKKIIQKINNLEEELKQVYDECFNKRNIIKIKLNKVIEDKKENHKGENNEIN